MADFGFLSDTDDSAVEELISQAQELSVLEQVAAINCSGFTDSVLPPELESRFRRLKSLPVARVNPKATCSQCLYHSKSELANSVKHEEGSGSSSDEENGTFSDTKRNPNGKMGSKKNSSTRRDSWKNSMECEADYGSFSDEESLIFSGWEQNPHGKLGFKKNTKKENSSKGGAEYADQESENSSEQQLDFKYCNSSLGDNVFSPSKENQDVTKGSKEKLKNGSVSSPSDLSNFWTESSTFSTSKRNHEEKKNSKSKLKSAFGSFSSPLGSSKSRMDSSRTRMDSPSPPRNVGCFWCSPRKTSNKRSSEVDTGFDWNVNDDFLSDLSTFSVKEQQKMLKKAIQEQQKMSREAEKIVKLAKQSSARMNFHGIEDELNDDETTK